MKKKLIIPINDYKENDRLPGAVSSDHSFAYFTKKDGLTFKLMKDLITGEYIEDVENKLIIKKRGVVANAYDLKFLSEDERKQAIREILAENKMKYPEYEFEMAPGKFPVRYSAGLELDCGVIGSYPTMSTHVLYIKNYRRFIKNPKIIIKKR